MKKSTFLPLLLTLFLTANIFAQNSYYVSATGNDSDGSSVANAFLTIGQAITAASDGDTIYIHETIETDQTYTIDKSLTFKGMGDSNLGRIKDDKTVRSDGFFNVTASGKTITFQDMVFQERFTQPNSGLTLGGVISMEVASDLNFTFCLFLGNVALEGGAIHFNAGNLTIDTCGFYSNAAANGGAISAAGSGTLTISNALFDGNGNVEDKFSGYIFSSRGGAILVNDSALRTTISTSVFAKNLIKDVGGALYFDGTNTSSKLEKITVYKNTLTNATSTVTDGGGIYITGDRPFSIVSSLIYGNTSSNNDTAFSDISLDSDVSAFISNTLAGVFNGPEFSIADSNLEADLNSSDLSYKTADASEEDGFGTITNNNRHVTFKAPTNITHDTPIDFGANEDVGEWDSEITLFEGTVSSDWATPTNWSSRSVPKATDNVTITDGLTNQPVISATTGAVADSLIVNSASTLTIESGGSLIVSSGSEGNITYKVAIPDDKWHLVSSPVVGEQYDDAWVTANSIASGSVNSNNRGIATYDNTTSDATTAHWRYFQAGGTATFDTGVGYSLKNSNVGGGNYSFEGTFPTDDVTPAISQGTNNWNLLGNPYPSYLDITAFINTNRTSISDAFETIYVWNATADEYQTLTSGYLHPGQAFFINSDIASGGTASITEAMQSHRTGVTFYRTNNTDPSIELMLSDDTVTKNTQINYLEGKTRGLDSGFDLGMFNGTSSNLRLYTHLIEDNQGIAFGTQALPNSDLESMVIPVGVKAEAGKEIMLSVEALNLPTDLKVFLEDKVTNTFTRLDEANTEYTVTLSKALDGVGRFYVHTSTSVLTVDDVTLNTIQVYKSDVSTLRIVGLPQGNTNVKLYNVLGKQVLNTSFDDNAKDISLPKLATGVYIVDVQTEIGKLNKKIILE